MQACGLNALENYVNVKTHDICRVVYCVVTEANLGIMSCRYDTHPSRHYAGCCLYLDRLEFYQIFNFVCNYITSFRTRKIYDVHV